MVLKTTRWKPDTCRCEIEYEWDTEESPNTRAHNLKRLLKKCPDHAGVVESKVLATITVENSMKNHILKEILDNNESLREQAYNGSGQPSGFNLKTDLNYEWNFEGKDEERTLKVAMNSLQIVIDNQTSSSETADFIFFGFEVILPELEDLLKELNGTKDREIQEDILKELKQISGKLGVIKNV